MICGTVNKQNLSSCIRVNS